MNTHRFIAVAMSVAVGLCLLPAEGAEKGQQSAPEVDVVFGDDLPVPQMRIYHIEFETKNLDTNQVICIFLETEKGEYIPVPRERITPSVIPVNERTKTAIGIAELPEGEEVSLCFFALDPWDQRMIAKWMELDNPGESSKIIRRATRLGSVALN